MVAGSTEAVVRLMKSGHIVQVEVTDFAPSLKVRREEGRK